MQRIEKRLTQVESIASATLFIFGIFTAMRGLNWVVFSGTSRDYTIYSAIVEVAPLYFWGGLLLFGGLMFMIASWLLPRWTTERRFSIILMIGGFFTGITYFIIAIASFNQHGTWLVPAQMVVLSALGGILAFFGGASLWHSKITKRQ